jgi:hypothetical protein
LRKSAPFFNACDICPLPEVKLLVSRHIASAKQQDVASMELDILVFSDLQNLIEGDSMRRKMRDIETFLLGV